LPIRILGISGSGRKGSYNTALIRAAKVLVPPNVELETFDISRLPLFNEDLEESTSAVVNEFRRKVSEADAILFATPEYNYSVTAVIKNAVEWGNRPDNAWTGKPAAIISASISPRGGTRAQLHLRQIMADLDMHPINRPQLLLANAQDKFDESLNLTDERTQETIRQILVALAKWTYKLRPELVDKPTAVIKN